MIVLTSLRGGMQNVNRNAKFLLLLWLVNIGFALLLAEPVFKLLAEFSEHSLMGSPKTDLFSGFDPWWFISFQHAAKGELQQFPTLIVAVAVIYVLIHVFLNGGVFAVLTAHEGKSLFIDFFYGSVKYFYRFLKVFLVALVVFGAIYFGNEYLASGIERWTANIESEQFVVALHGGRAVLLVLVFLVVSMIFDYARIRMVLEDTSQALRATWNGLRFVFRHVTQTFSLYFLISAISVALFALYFALEGILHPGTILGVIIVFLLEEFYIIAKLWTRLLFFASQIQLYRDLTAPVLSVAAEES